MSPRVLGIDPGTVQLGWGIVQGGARPVLVAAGCCRAPTRLTASQRLAHLARQLDEVLERVRPDHVAMETSFHGKNSQALLRLGEARGMVIGELGRRHLDVTDYTPAVVKKAVTGRGNSSKEGVARMVRALLAPPRTVSRSPVDGSSANAAEVLLDAPLDITDALAVALCHVHHLRWLRPQEGPRTATRGAGSQRRD